MTVDTLHIIVEEGNVLIPQIEVIQIVAQKIRPAGRRVTDKDEKEKGQSL